MVRRAPAGTVAVLVMGAPVVRRKVSVRLAAVVPGFATRTNVWNANGPPTRPSARAQRGAVSVTPKALLASFHDAGFIGQYIDRSATMGTSDVTRVATLVAASDAILERDVDGQPRRRPASSACA